MTNLEHGFPRASLSLVSSLPEAGQDTQEYAFSAADLLFGYNEERARHDWDYIRTNLFIIGGVVSRVEDMHSRLFEQSPRAHFHLRSALQKRVVFMDLPLHDVCRLIMLSDRRQWDTGWLYFSALVFAFAGRLHQASALAEDE